MSGALALLGAALSVISGLLFFSAGRAFESGDGAEAPAIGIGGAFLLGALLLCFLAGRVAA